MTGSAETAGRLVRVTRGAGFIGSRTVGRFVAAGRRVVVPDDVSAGHALRSHGA